MKIEVRNLQKSFGELVVIKDLSTTIESGEIISLIGPSGTGKSVFLRCLNLLETPSAGEIIVDGENILDKKADVCKLRQRMGMVFQSFNLFSHLMVIENIMLAPCSLLGVSRKESLEEAIRLLGVVGLADKAYAYPDELSGGQKQRVAIARALAMKPQMLLMDEPTSALDPTKVSEVLSVIKRLAEQGMSMIIVTHEMRFAREVSTRVFYMDEGSIYEDGTSEQIFDNPQREKTRAFINRIRSYSLDIKSKSFDVFEMNAAIEEFVHKNLLTAKQLRNIQLYVEEVVIRGIVNSLDNVDLTLTISYFEASGVIEIDAVQRSVIDNPLENIQDDLAAMIIERIIRERAFKIESGVSRLKVVLG